MISGTRRTKISIGHFESLREFKKRGKREERARNYYLGIKGRGVVRRQGRRAITYSGFTGGNKRL